MMYESNSVRPKWFPSVVCIFPNGCHQKRFHENINPQMAQIFEKSKAALAQLVYTVSIVMPNTDAYMY